MITRSASLKIMLSSIFLVSSFCLRLSALHAETGLEGVEIMFLEGRYEKAGDEARRLIDARARHTDELYYLKGLSELKTSRFRQARESFEKIILKYQRSARTFDAHVGIGDSYFLAVDAEQALLSYKEALDKFPDDKNAFVPLYRMGNCYQRLGDGDSAKRYFDKAKRASPLGFEAFETAKRFGAGTAGPEAPKIEAGRLISVQVGSFRDKKNADRLALKLSRAGYDSYIEELKTFDERLYRVRVGRFRSAEEAKPLESRLKCAGYKTKISSGTL